MPTATATRAEGGRGRVIFADSSGLIGLLVARDACHARAAEAVQRLTLEGARLLTSNCVFDEVVSRVKRRAGPSEACMARTVARTASWPGPRRQVSVFPSDRDRA